MGELLNKVFAQLEGEQGSKTTLSQFEDQTITKKFSFHSFAP